MFEFLRDFGLMTLVWREVVYGIIAVVGGFLVEERVVVVLLGIHQRFCTNLAFHFLQILELFEIDLGLERDILLRAHLSLRKSRRDICLTVKIVQG